MTTRPTTADVLVAWQCANCGQIAEVPAGVTVTCHCGAVDRWASNAKSPPKVFGRTVPPSLARRTMNYILAYMHWSKAGKPIRHPAAVAALRVVCRNCDYFNGDICAHKRCGCSVAEPGLWHDKLMMLTEDCPDIPPRWPRGLQEMQAEPATPTKESVSK